jgi:hypothetical protein
MSTYGAATYSSEKPKPENVITILMYAVKTAAWK